MHPGCSEHVKVTKNHQILDMACGLGHMVRPTVECPEIPELQEGSFHAPPYASPRKTMFVAFATLGAFF